MAIEQPDPWPVPHWHVHRDHWPTHGRGRMIRTFKSEKEGQAYLAHWPERMREIAKERRGKICFDDTNPDMQEATYNGKTARLRKCLDPICYDGYGNERYD